MTTAALVEGLAAATKCIIEKCTLGQWESICVWNQVCKYCCWNTRATQLNCFSFHCSDLSSLKKKKSPWNKTRLCSMTRLALRFLREHWAIDLKTLFQWIDVTFCSCVGWLQFHWGLNKAPFKCHISRGINQINIATDFSQHLTPALLFARTLQHASGRWTVHCGRWPLCSGMTLQKGFLYWPLGGKCRKGKSVSTLWYHYKISHRQCEMHKAPIH